MIFDILTAVNYCCLYTYILLLLINFCINNCSSWEFISTKCELCPLQNIWNYKGIAKTPWKIIKYQFVPCCIHWHSSRAPKHRWAKKTKVGFMSWKSSYTKSGRKIKIINTAQNWKCFDCIRWVGNLKTHINVTVKNNGTNNRLTLVAVDFSITNIENNNCWQKHSKNFVKNNDVPNEGSH